MKSEGAWENDFYEPKRFFAMYEDDEIVKIMARRFEVEDFHYTVIAQQKQL